MTFRRAVTASSILAATAACGGTTDPMRVAEVVPRIRSLNGDVVNVAGYLGECAGYECRLFVDEAGWHEFQRAIVKMRTTREAVKWPMHLGIGSGESISFDKKARPFAESYVVITGKITDECRDQNNEPGCIDRSTDLKPTDIRSWPHPASPRS